MSTVKACTKCGVEKSMSEFYREAKKRDGLQSRCRQCSNAGRAAWAAANPERRTCQGAGNPNRKQYQLHAHWWSLYRIRPEQAAHMWNNQGGKCKLCLAQLAHFVACLDHDHGCCPGRRSCGKCVRGWLCAQCNTRLGWFETNQKRILQYTGIWSAT